MKQHTQSAPNKWLVLGLMVVMLVLTIMSTVALATHGSGLPVWGIMLGALAGLTFVGTVMQLFGHRRRD